MASAPKDSWFIYADADELFDYPCNISPNQLNRNLCMVGMMWDQLAANGNISEASESSHLHEQFPLQCRVRATIIPKSNPYKTIITTTGGGRFPTIRFRNTHAVNSTRGKPCQPLGAVRHYSLTGQQLANNAERRSIHPKALRGRDAKIAKRMPNDPLAAKNYANATCGNPDPFTGACLDYEILYKWMATQVQRVSEVGTARITGHMCPRNVTSELYDTQSYEEMLAASSYLSVEDRVLLARAIAAKLIPATPELTARIGAWGGGER